jgi:biopolymer transport protein ExbD
MRRKVARQPTEEPTVNLTPLIDVVFVILIMFIVVAPLLEMEKIELASASPYDHESIAVQENGRIAIHVRKDDTVWFNGDRVNQEQLLYRLQQARGRYPDVSPQMFNDREAKFGTYQAVKSVVEAAGFQELDIVLKPS